jgi:hypothetical protein
MNLIRRRYKRVLLRRRKRVVQMRIMFLLWERAKTRRRT